MVAPRLPTVTAASGKPDARPDVHGGVVVDIRLRKRDGPGDCGGSGCGGASTGRAWSSQRVVDAHSHECEGEAMSGHVYGVTEIVGTSPDSLDAAIKAGIARAATTLRGLDWFEV